MYFIHDYTLFFKNPEDKRNLLCISKSLGQEIVSKAHKSLGHLGYNKTYNYWQNIVVFRDTKKSVYEYVTTCLDCQKSKAPQIPAQSKLTGTSNGKLEAWT